MIKKLLTKRSWVVFFLLLTASQMNAQSITIGSGTSNSNGNGADPVDDFYNGMHYQTVYTATELSTAGLTAGSSLTSIGFEVTESPGTLGNYTVQLAHTTQANASTYIDPANVTFTTVVTPFNYTPTVQTSGNFDVIMFTTNFTWDGSSNIVVDICTGPSNPYASPYGGVAVTTGVTGGGSWTRVDGAGASAICSAPTGIVSAGILSYGVLTQKPNVRFDYIPGAACSGTPSAGVASATGSAASGSVCPNVTFSLITTGATSASGLTYDWQYDDGNGWQSTGGTSTSYMVTGGITVATDYRLIIGCGSLFDTSNVVSIAVNSFYNCYCTPASTCVNEGIVNVTMGTLNNTSAMCTSGGYQDFTGLGSQVTVTQGQQIAISVTDSINSNPSSAGVWIDYDHSGTFDASEFTLVGSTTVFSGTKMLYTFTANINIPVGALTGVTAMRVRGANSSTPVAASGNYGPCNGVQVYGEYEDYLITINAGTPCSSMPAGGNLTSSITSTSCPRSFVLSASGFSSGVTGLSFQWQESTDNINFTNIGSATTDYINDTVSTISQTMYYRLEISCTNGTGLIAYSDTVTVNFSPLSVFPWLDDVETQNNNTNSVMINCWSSIPTNTTSAYAWYVGGSTPSSGTGPNSAFSGSKFFYTEGSNGATGAVAELISPAIDITPLSVPLLEFYYHMYGVNMGSLSVEVFDGVSWTPVGTPLTGQQQTSGGAAWLKQSIPLTGYTGTIQIKFVGVRGAGFESDMSIDNISVIEAPSCLAPSSLTASNVMATSADLNWVENNSATNWLIEYGPAPLTPGTGTVDYTLNNPYTIVSGLTPGTNYQFYVRSVCNPGSDTSVAATGTFKTPPGCGGNFYDSGGPTGVYSNYEDDTTTIYPINPGDQVTVTFSSFYTEGGYDYLYVYDGPDPSYPLLGTFDGQLTGSNLPGPFTSSDPSGALTFRFHSDVSGTYNGWEATVTCAPPPSCLAPTSLSATNVMAVSADLNWVDNNGASLWEVEYGPAPLIAGAGTVDYTASNPYSIVSGLASGTNYQFNVRAICSAGDTSGIASGYFKTPPGCGGNFYDSGGPTGVYTNYEDDTTTIYPTNSGDQVTVAFSSFYTESGYDYLYVYDGPDVTYPLLGTFSGNLNSNLPGPFTSSDASGALTFRFHSDVSGTYDGWAATVTCAPPPTCAIPSALGASNITITTADLDWTENGSAAQWEIEYAQGNTFTIGNGTREMVNAKPYTLGSLTPLMPSTQYSYFVRSICGANDTSAWSGRYTFNTVLGNDLPAGAVPLTLGAGCSGLIYTNTGGTLSAGEPVISCRGTSLTSGMTVWFSFVAPQSGFVKISTDVSGSLDTKLGLFTTSNPTDPTDLASFSIIGCDDDNGVIAGASSIIYASDLAPGTTYYIAVDHYNGTSAGNFCVMVDSVTTIMISPSGSCASSSNTTSLRQDYLAWVTLVDDQGRLIANTMRTVAGTSTVAAYTPSLTVNTSAVRDYNGQYYLDRNFAFTYGGTATGTTFDLKLYFLNPELTALNTVDANATLPNLNVTHATGSCASSFGNTGTISALLQSGNGTDGSISWVNVNTPGFSNFYIMSGLDPLVIRLGDITATNIGTSNRVEWNTLSEERSDKFELERSVDGKTFTTIYKKAANGEASRYTYMDNDPVKGYNYYRLRMIEANGNATYSEVVKAFVKSTGFEVEAYPNPVSHDLTVKVSGVQGADAAVQVTDVTGKVIRTIKMTGNVETINMSGLTNGIYLIKYSDANHTQTIRVNKQ